MRTTKKSQITVFILIGLVLVIIFGLGTYAIVKWWEDRVKAEREITEYDTNVMENYFEGCLQKEGLKALVKLGSLGGYTAQTPNPYSYGEFVTSYAYKDGNNVLPSLSVMEGQLAGYLKEHFLECPDIVRYMADTGLSVSVEASGIAVQINKEDVLHRMNLSVIIMKGDEVRDSFEFESKDIRIEHRLMLLRFLANQLVESKMATGHASPTKCIADEDVIISTTHKDNATLFIIEDFASETPNHRIPYKFVFAVSD